MVATKSANKHIEILICVVRIAIIGYLDGHSDNYLQKSVSQTGNSANE